MQEFTVSGLAIDSANQSPVVLLKELDGDRVLPLPFSSLTHSSRKNSESIPLRIPNGEIA